jgi:zinc transport system substrate-binding protein
VVTAFYPLQFLSERIGGATVTVTDLTKPGAEPHDVELNPRQVARSATPGWSSTSAASSRPWTTRSARRRRTGSRRRLGGAAAADPRRADTHRARSTRDAGGMDPHVWLDPVRFATIADQLGERLARPTRRTPPATAPGPRPCTPSWTRSTRVRRRAQTCARREIVTSHTAFDYLATGTG